MTQQPAGESIPDQIVLVIVQDQDSGEFSSALNEAGIRHTRIKSAGGFLQVTNVMFVIGIHHAQVDELVGIISATCETRTELVTVPWSLDMEYLEPIEVEVGGATLFAIDLERFERV